MSRFRVLAVVFALTATPILAADDPFADWRSCPASRKEFAGRLETLNAVSARFENLSDDEKMALVVEPGWQGVYLLHFDTSALPDNMISGFSMTCWASFYEATLATQGGRWVEADQAAGAWQSCVEAMYRETTPQEVRQVRRCFSVARRTAK